MRRTNGVVAFDVDDPRPGLRAAVPTEQSGPGGRHRAGGSPDGGRQQREWL